MFSGDEFDALLGAATAGDSVSLGRLLMTHYDQVAKRVLEVRSRLPEVGVPVEDMVQLTFVRAIRGLSGLEGRNEQSFIAWLNVIAERETRNVVAAQLRLKRGGDHQQIEFPDPSRQSSIISLANLVSDPQPTPGRALAQQDAVRAIQIGLSTLPEDQRAAMHLHYLEGKSVDDTAGAMQRSPGAIRGLLRRARQTLRTALGHSSRWFDKRS